MRMLRYWMRLILAFANKFKLVLFFGVVTGFFGFVLARFLLPLAWGGHTERIGLVGRYHVEDLPQSVIEMVSIGLTVIDDQGRVQPGLAKEWDSEEEGKKWTFKLKDGLAWHDGEKVISETINYNFEGEMRVDYPNEGTIVFELKNPLAAFPSILARPIFKKGLIGVGEWKVSKVSLVGDYVEKITLRRGRDRKIYSFYPTEEKLKTAYKLGSVDVLEDLLDPSPFDEWSTANLIEEPNSDRYVAIFLNNQSEVFSSNKALRQALYYSIDKKVWGERAFGPISPNSWAYNPQVKDYEYDQRRARELIEEVGSEAIEALNIQLVVSPVLLNVAEKVAQDWRVVGVKTTILVSSVIPVDYQAFMAIVDVSRDPDQYAMWHSTQMETNISNYSNPRIDKLLEDGRKELNEDDRKKIYLDFQRFLLEDAPAIFLYHPISYTVERK